MKILKKIGAIALGLLLSIKTFAVKVYATAVERRMDATMICDYGVWRPEPEISATSKAFPIFSVIIIPIILLIGLIIFFIKSTSSMLKKVLITLGIVITYLAIMIITKNF